MTADLCENRRTAYTMKLYEILLLAVGLSMDAFAVSVCKGLALGKNATVSKMCIVGLWFGAFQALMPVLGYFLGSAFASLIGSFDKYIAFGLLSLIGANMIKEALSKEEKDKESASLAFSAMLIMALATSIDALAVGVSFAFLEVNIIFSALVIGITTFTLSFAGVKVGGLFGTRYKSKAELAGGVILILLGIKFLLEGLGVFPS